LIQIDNLSIRYTLSALRTPHHESQLSANSGFIRKAIADGRWTQAGLSQMFTSRKDLPKYTSLAEKILFILSKNSLWQNKKPC